MNESSRLQNKTVGRCIYCGAGGDLSEEHIVPFAIWGDLTLKEASCVACAEATSKQELKVLRGFMLNWRTVNRSPTRKKKNRPATIRMKFGNDQREWDADVPAEEALAFLPLPLIDGPAILAAPEQTELRVSGFNRQSPDSSAFIALIRKHNATKGRLECALDPFPFCAMLVKIAYAYAAYSDISFDCYEMFAPELIRERPEQAWRYVASYHAAPPRITKPMHSLAVGDATINGKVYLFGAVNLFSRFGATPYHVVLGKRI